MFVLLQVYPPEATAEDGSDDCCCLDVIAVAPSEAELERFLGIRCLGCRPVCRLGRGARPHAGGARGQARRASTE